MAGNTVRMFYPGMGTDILGPLLLCPDVTHIYVIDPWKRVYQWWDADLTIDGVRDTIKSCLQNGTNYHLLNDRTKKYALRIGIKPEIIEEVLDLNEKSWTLKFYTNHIVTLKYYYERKIVDVNEEKDQFISWPRDIDNIDIVYICNDSLEVRPSLDMFKTRCHDNTIVYCEKYELSSWGKKRKRSQHYGTIDLDQIYNIGTMKSLLPTIRPYGEENIVRRE